MASYVVQAGQTLADVVLMMAGTMEALPSIALANGLNMSDSVSPGDVINYPAVYPTDPVVLTELGRSGYVIGVQRNN